ncbi:unnamed protein product [Rhizoctonia solani]|nr:unnamed protein product [Rhizoctonia solani]
MSPLIPANLSQTLNRKKKHEKDPTVFHGSYEEVLQKSHAVPITPVDPLELLEPDEPGAELAKEARVWKVYVKEADKWDTELIEGWNRSLDVILVFAALFSAVLTAFIIESPKC